MQSLIKDIFEYRYINFYYVASTLSIEEAIEMHLWAKWRELKVKYKAGE